MQILTDWKYFSFSVTILLSLILLNCSSGSKRPYRDPLEKNFTEGTWCKGSFDSRNPEYFRYDTEQCFAFSYSDTEQNLYLTVNGWPDERRFYVQEAKCVAHTCYVRDSNNRELRIRFIDSETLEIVKSWRRPIPNIDHRYTVMLMEGEMYRAIVWQYRPSKTP